MSSVGRRAVAVAAFFLAFQGATAQEAPALQPAPWPRWEAAVLGGYRFEGTFHLLGDAPYPKIEIDNTFTFAFSLGYNVSPSWGTELNYSYANPGAIAVAPGDASPAFDIGMHEFQAGLLLYLAPPEARTRVYLELLLGATVLNTSRDVGDTVKFTPGISLGVKTYPSEHVGVRAEIHYTPMYLYTTGNGTTLCFDYGGCWDTGARYLQQVDLRAGATFRF